jgi:hypothetical protein
MSDDPRAPEPELTDQLAALRAAIDQGAMLAPEIARAAFASFSAFTDKGFTAPQALYLTAVQLRETPGEAPR